MRDLVDAFYRERSLANHHIMSYNDFANYWLQDIIDKIKVGDDETEEVRIGDMPIMVKSAKCNITKENLERHEGTIFTPEEYYRRLVELQEDPIDIGGYFIINGTERVLISLEDLAPNRVMVEF